MAGQVYFLDVKIWEQYGFVNENIDPAKLKPIVLRVQATRIENLLGTTLYNKLIADTPNFSGIYKELMDDYVIFTLIAYSDWKYTFHGTSQMTNKTVGHNNDQNITSNTVEQNNDLRDELLKDAKHFERKLIGWLQDNKEDIPEYCDTPTDKRHQSMKPAKDKNDFMGNFIIT